MSYSTGRGYWTRTIMWILLLAFVFFLIFMPKVLASLTLPEQAFIVTLLVFVIVYSRIFGGTFFVLDLLGMIERGEDIVGAVRGDVQKGKVLKLLEEANLLLFVEGLVVEINKVFSFYYDMTLVFLLVLTLLYLGVPLPTVQAIVVGAAVAVLPIMLVGLFANMHLNARFAEVFVKEIKEFEELTKNLRLSDLHEEEIEFEVEEGEGEQEAEQKESDENKESA